MFLELISGSLLSILDKIWFDFYSRASRSSSGIEHVFVGEIKSGKVSGFHNWISFLLEEDNGNANYQGYLKLKTLGNKVSMLYWCQEIC